MASSANMSESLEAIQDTPSVEKLFQTLDMATPQTPVMTGKYANVPEITMTPASETSSIFSEGPETSSPSSTVVSNCSLDDYESPSLNEAINTLETNDFAETEIKDPAVLSATFHIDGELVVFRKHISLDTSSEDVTMMAGGLCLHWRESKADFMRTLKLHGQGVHMRVSISFEDRRDIYVNRNQHGEQRFQTVRDMFDDQELNALRASGKPPVLPLLVYVTVVNLAPGEKIQTFPPLEQEIPAWAYHRVGSWVVEGTKSQHLAPNGGCYARYDRKGSGVVNTFIETRERTFNGLAIGSLLNGQHHNFIPHRDHLVLPYKIASYRGNEAVRKEINRSTIRHTAFRIAEPTPALLPPMTYNTYKNPLTAALAPDKPIHLSIRLVGVLPHLPFLRLPSNVEMTVMPGRGTRNAMQYALTKALYNFSHENPFCGIRSLFADQSINGNTEPSLDDEIQIEFWVLPQKAVGEKLHSFEQASLKSFLDPEMVEKGQFMLYVEAWLRRWKRGQWVDEDDMDLDLE